MPVNSKDNEMIFPLQGRLMFYVPTHATKHRSRKSTLVEHPQALLWEVGNDQGVGGRAFALPAGGNGTEEGVPSAHLP